MDNYRTQEPFAKNGLYDPRFEHENCGIGAVVNMSGKTDRKVVDSALRIVETLEHRAGKDAEGKTGDGRAVQVMLTPEGKKVEAFHRRCHRRIIAEICEDLSEEEREELLHTMTRINSYFQTKL